MSLLDRIALSFMTGILFDYSLILSGLSYSMIQKIIPLLALVGMFFWAKNLKTGVRPIRWGAFAFITYALVVLFIKETSEGLVEWDARSIWFFNAKILWHAGGLIPGIEINHPSFTWTAVDHPDFGSILWAHPDYPKLIPALAGQIATYFGFWNDYLTKISLFLVIGSPVLVMARFAKWSFSFVLLCFTLYCSAFAVLWNGYMDGGTALFSALTTYLLVRHSEKNDSLDLIYAIICTGFLFGLKNEGLLLGLCIWSVYFLFACKKLLAANKKTLWVFGGTMIPTLLWTIRKSQLQLKGDFKFLSTETFQKMSTRLQDGSLKQIFMSVIVQHAYTWKAITLAASVLCGAFLIAKFKKLTFPKIALFPALVGMVFLSGMLLIYLSTPFQLAFHLNTSVDRTMISFYAIMLVSVVKVLDWVGSDFGNADH